MRNKFFYFAAANLFAPIFRVFSVQSNEAFRILLLHNVDDLAGFDKLISYLSRHFSFLDPQDLGSPAKILQQTGKPKVMISFDDGYLSSVQAIKNVLEPKGLKAMFFVSPDFIGLDNGVFKDYVANKLFAGRMMISQVTDRYRPMTWADLAGLVKAGHVIGAHTLNHVCLSSLTNQLEKAREILESKNILEQKLGIPIKAFAYPFGSLESIDRESYRIIKANFAFCFTGIRGANTIKSNHYYMYREAIDLKTPFNYIRFLLNGGLDLFYSKKRRLLEVQND